MSRESHSKTPSPKSFRITEQAAQQIKRAAREAGLADLSLRVAAKRDKDGPIDYAMGFDEPNDTDSVVAQHDVKILIGVTSIDLLVGAVLDYVRPDGDPKERFIFLNPNDPGFIPPDREA